MSTEENVSRVVPLLMVEEMERSLAYYREGLGFSLANTWVVEGKIRWCWLNLEGVALMLQEWTPGTKPANLGKAGGGASFWFSCKDSIAIYRKLKTRGIEVSEPQVGNFAWECFLKDPDGYSINFSSPTDFPDETLLSQTDL